jgi:hypothetical protein
MPQTKEAIAERRGHSYFLGSEDRYEKGTGLELALNEMAARRRKTEALRAARQAADRQDEGQRHSMQYVARRTDDLESSQT